MLPPNKVLDSYFPEVRAWLIQIAAVMDRYDRAAAEHGSAGPDDRLKLYQQALEVLARTQARAERAEKIQMIFSEPYEKK